MIHAAKTTLNALPGADDISRVELPNGIVILTRSNFNSPSIVITGYVAAGGLFDSDEKAGLADFTALSLMRGTAKRNFQQIYDALESAGASLGWSAGNHTTSFSGRALVEDLPLLLDLLSESVTGPVFPADQVERLRAQLLTGLAIRAQDTGEMAALTFDEMIYAGHPYRRPEDGYPETIAAIQRDDLVAFHKRCFGPRGMVISIVGGIEAQKAVDMVTEALGSWQNPDQPAVPELPPTTPITCLQRRNIPIAGKTQADIIMGALGPTRLAPEYVAASLGNNILGQFGLMGRIGDVVRERSGLAYYAYTSLNAGIGPGSWEVAAGVNPVNIEKTIELVRSEIGRFISEPVSAEELDDSQSNYIGRLPISMESNQGVAASLLNLERYKLGLDYYRQYETMIRRVTPQMVMEAAQAYLHPDRLAVAVAGPVNGDGAEA
ncbi:MAG TPA: pitrilysin family protein [Anaerolineaceae bacterium]|nr:pitrilysin family protein [Anaerolineaceae bacterium]HPN51192.1 pitrilysin family protein [Anaerolineaceae bacterium]